MRDSSCRRCLREVACRLVLSSNNSSLCLSKRAFLFFTSSNSLTTCFSLWQQLIEKNSRYKRFVSTTLFAIHSTFIHFFITTFPFFEHHPFKETPTCVGGWSAAQMTCLPLVADQAPETSRPPPLSVDSSATASAVHSTHPPLLVASQSLHPSCSAHPESPLATFSLISTCSLGCPGAPLCTSTGELSVMME